MKLRIAFVSDTAFPWHIGGVEKTEYVTAVELAKKHDVHFFSFRWPLMKKEFRHKGITYHTIHELSNEMLYKNNVRSVKEALSASSVAWQLFRYKFDVVIVNSFPYMHIPVVKLYARLFKCKLIFDVAEVWSTGRWNSYMGKGKGRAAYIISKNALVGADAYISNPGETAAALQKLGISSSKIHEFSPIIDDKLMNKIRPKSAKNRIVYSGRLIKEKRLDKWLSVLKETRKLVPSANGIMIGEGPEKEKISRLIKKMGLERCVKVTGYFKNINSVFSITKGSIVALNMSEREGLSATALESLALGTPVVLPSYSPIPDVVKRMCVVGNEKMLPKRIAQIMRSKNKGQFIKNKGSLVQFYSSRTGEFYDKLFNSLGLHG